MLLIKCKQYCKNPVLLIATIIYFTWIIKVLFPIYINEVKDITICVPYPLGFIPVSFVFFVFLSYSFFSKDQSEKIDEVISVCEFGKLRSYLSGLIVLSVINITLFAVLIVYLFECCIGAMGVLDRNVILFGIQCYAIHMVLPNLFAMLIGMMVSFVRSEIKAYSILICICCFFSQFFLSSLYGVVDNGEMAFRVVDLFGFTTRMYHASADMDYIFSIENVEIQRIFFWIFLMVTIFLYKTVKKYRRFFVCCSAVITIAFLMFYMLPSGAAYVNVGNHNDTWTEESTYYRNHKEQVGVEENQVSQNPFKITKYEAKLKVDRILKANVKVYVDQNKLDEYVFSLRHEFKVKHVIDEYGEELSFVQNGDHVSVKIKDMKAHDSFLFEYEGASKLYFSTAQAIRLPAYFAYLPFSGKRYLYFDWQYNFSKDEYLSTYSGSSLEGLGYETEYDIMIDTKLDVYSNLPEIDENHFRGISGGATLMANPYLVKEKIGGCNLIYSKVAYRYLPNSAFPIMKDWEEFIKNNPVEEKTIFVLGITNGSNEEHRYFSKDHLILEIPDEDGYQEYLKTGKMPYYDKDMLRDAIENQIELKKMEESQ